MAIPFIASEDLLPGTVPSLRSRRPFSSMAASLEFGEVFRPQVKQVVYEAKRVEGLTVKPERFFGLEVNRRAVEIAELVLWLGYIQWHLRTRPTDLPQPVLGSRDHVREQDALLTWDGYPDKKLKLHLGRLVAGPEGRETYLFPNARRPEWPAADYIVGNPPFIGGKDTRGRLGSDYAEALWGAYPHVNPSADFVMYWWDRAAELLTRKDTPLRRFGLVTTNSITQVFQRRVIERRLGSASPISLLLAIPDHPWTKAGKDAAAVRIAMTVAAAGEDHIPSETPFHGHGLDEFAAMIGVG